jgi:hypothetical protein
MFDLKAFIKENLLDKNGNPSSRKKDWLFNPSNNNEQAIVAMSEAFGVDVNTVDKVKLNELMYCFINDISQPECKVCSSPTPFQNFGKGYAVCCSPACSAKLGGASAKQAYNSMSEEEYSEVLKKRGDTLESKHGEGVRSPLQIKGKAKQASIKARGTKKDRYGEKLVSEESLEKTRQTLLKKYGVSNMAFISNERSSQYEDYVCSLLDYWGIVYERRYRKHRYEIDIFIPSKNIGIEIHGEYWHSIDVNPKGNKNYHFEKYREASSNGITLIQLFSTEVKTEATKLLLKSKLGILERVYARNTEVSFEPKSDEIVEFLNTYHPRGFVPSTYYITLRNQGELLSVMTLLKAESELNLTRFSSKLSVVGGFTKCLSLVKGQDILTFLDLRYSLESSNVYSKSGFDKVSFVEPDYMYFFKGKLVHKFSMRKRQLLALGAIGETESEMAESIKALRVYDAGKIKYILRRNK